MPEEFDNSSVEVVDTISDNDDVDFNDEDIGEDDDSGSSGGSSGGNTSNQNKENDVPTVKGDNGIEQAVPSVEDPETGREVRIDNPAVGNTGEQGDRVRTGELTDGKRSEVVVEGPGGSGVEAASAAPNLAKERIKERKENLKEAQKTSSKRVEKSNLNNQNKSQQEIDARQELFQQFKQESRERFKEAFGIKKPDLPDRDFGTIDDPDFYRTQRLKDKANLTSGETSMLQTLASQSVLENSARRGGTQITGSERGGQIAVGGLTGNPISPADSLIALEQGTSIAQTIADEPSKRLPNVPSATVQGAGKIASEAKQNPTQFFLEEGLFELASVGGPSVTTTTTSKTPDNVNVEVQESFLPDLESAQGDTLIQSRIKQGSGETATPGQETSRGQSITKTGNDQSQTKAEQPSLFGQVEYEVDGETFREQFIGQTDTTSKTTVNQKDTSQNPFEGGEFLFDTESQSTVRLEQIGENGKVGENVNNQNPDQIIIDEAQTSGRSRTNPLAVEADPEGNVRVGFEQETRQSGEVAGQDFDSFTESSGVRDLQRGLAQTRSRTKTDSVRGTGRTKSDNLVIDEDSIVTQQQQTNRNVKNNNRNADSTQSQESQSENVDEDILAGIENLDIDLGLKNSQDSTKNTRDRGSDTKDFDQSNFDGSGGETNQIVKTESESAGDSILDSPETGTGQEAFKAALEDIASTREIEVTQRRSTTTPSTITKEDIEVEQDLNAALDQQQDELLGQDQRQENPPTEEKITKLTQDTTTTTTTSTTTTETPFLELTPPTLNPDVNTPPTNTPTVTPEPEQENNGSDDSFFDLLDKEQERDVRRSVGADILGISDSDLSEEEATNPLSLRALDEN